MRLLLILSSNWAWTNQPSSKMGALFKVSSRMARRVPSQFAMKRLVTGQAGAERRESSFRQLYSSGTISKATMLMILMSGFTAGPAVSL